MYKANAAAREQPLRRKARRASEQPETEEKKDEGVIDAEYVDVDDKK